MSGRRPFSLARWFARPVARHKPARWRPTIERLEDRATPAVTATRDAAGLLTITLTAAGDSATITGTNSGGTAIDVTGTGLATASFTAVTAVGVTGTGAGGGQSLLVNDSGTGRIALPGAFQASGVASVDLATATAPLGAGSVNIAGANNGIQLHGNVATTAAAGQTYNGPVVLGQPTVTLDAGTGGGVSFAQMVNSDVGSPRALVVNAGGVTGFASPVGGVNPLAALTTDAAGSTRIGANVTTTGAQTYNDPVTITGSPVSLDSTSSGNITFASTLDGQTGGTNSLTVNTAGTTRFGGAVGTTPLSALTTDAPGSTLVAANVSTIGAQAYGDPVKVSGAAVTFTSTGGANITFGSALDGATAGANAVTVNTNTGNTTFAGDVGAATPLASLTTDAGVGITIIGTGGASRSVNTGGAQTFNDAVRLDGTQLTFNAGPNGNITFGGAVTGTAAGATAAVLKTGGVTTFTGPVGAVPLASITTDDAGQAGEGTVIRAAVTTSGPQSYGDAVTIDPGTGVTGIALTSTTGGVSFGKTLGGTAAGPVTVKAGTNLTLGGSVTFSAAGSRFNAQAGSTGTGGFVIGTGLTVRADTQTWQAGDGAGGAGTTAAADLTTNAPGFRDASGSDTPRTFVLRQDAAVTDATLPALAQFGSAPPPNYTVVSDDAALTINSATTALAGVETANLTLGSAQTLTVGTTISAPNGAVRLRSVNADVSQTGGGITAAGLGVEAATAITLTGANAVAGTIAAKNTSGNIRLANGAAATVGTVGADPLGTVFTSVSGVAAGNGTVGFTQPGTSPLNLTIAAPVSGTTVTATGGPADDRVAVNYTLGGSLANGLAFAGNGGNDSLTLSDAGGSTAHTYAVNNGVTRDSGTAITYTGVESVSVTGGNAADNFDLTPDAAAAITAVGGLPTGTTGDNLKVELAGTANPNLSESRAADGFQGSASSGNRRTITFSQMEAVSPQADIRVTATAAPTVVSPGETVTLTVVVTNAGPDTASGVAIDDVIPAGLTASWTASATSGSSVAAAGGTGDIHTTATLAANGKVTFTITATVNTGTSGTLTNTATAGTAASAFDSNPANNQATATVAVQPLALTAVGAAAGGGPQVNVYNADGSLRFSFFAYDPSYRGGVTVATGDVTGDGVEDIVTGSASGSSHVKVFDGKTGAEIASFFAFPGFTGGVNVAVADGQVVAGAGPGGGPIVTGFSVVGGLTRTFSFFAYDPAFRGGVQVGGGEGFLAVGAGPGGGPHVKVFNANSLTQVASFYAFPPVTTDGVSVAIGTANGKPVVIAGAGAGSSPAVALFDAATGATVQSFLAFEPGFQGGVRVASTSTATGQPAVAIGPGPGGAPRARVLTPDGTAALDFFPFDPSFRGGVYVG